VMTVSVCLSVCLSTSISPELREYISGTTSPVFTKFLTNVTRVLGSVLLWQRCDMVCSSGFTGDVIFAHNEPYAGVKQPASQPDGAARWLGLARPWLKQQAVSP